MKLTFPKLALASTLLGVSLTAPATDLDLYVNLPTPSAAARPNVLFIIDNTANWNQAFANEKGAIATTLRNLPVNLDGSAKFNVGFMFQSETGGSDSGEKGGYIRAAIRPMDATNKAKYEAMINALGENADKSNGGSGPLSMAEAYRYFSGGVPYAGNQKAKSDYRSNTEAPTALQAVHNLPGNALNAKGSTRYNSPIVEGSCAKNFIIYISNGPNQSNSQGDTQANNMLFEAAGGGAAGTAAIQEINIPGGSGSQSSPADEWARWLKKSPYAVVTYTIDVDPGTTGQAPGWTKVLKSMAGTNYVAVSSANSGAAIADAINDALSKIQSVNSVFAAVSLPASANVQGAFLNQLYVGMFRPDPDSKPRWSGNMKQYRLGDLQDLVDSNGASAINTQTGFIAECAVAYWSPTKGADTYWSEDPKGRCIPPGNNPNLYSYANSPDGNIVEKGAQAFMLRAITPSTRTVKTCSLSSCTALTDFNATNVSALALGAASSTEQAELISWARGANIDGELGKPTTVMRPSAHGDVIHSNPLALSYNNNSDVVVFYGSNEGMLHAVNGNRTTAFGASTFAAGAELWSFMPPEFYPHIKRLRANSTLVTVTDPVATGTPSVLTTAPAHAPKPFGIDGPIAAYRSDTETWIYTAMRRGGRAVYAFDVTNPLSPALKWKSGCPSELLDTGCSATTSPSGVVKTMAGIGQTWSIPRPVKARGYSSGSAPLIIMGGGYDTCEDADINTCTALSKGRKVYVLDANTGAIVKILDTDRGVVADIRFVPDAGGFAQYGYAADLGGNIYRITIGSAAPDDWTILKIASLGCDTAATCTNNRKFMFAPSVIPELDGSISIYGGTGDREKPLGATYFPNNAGVANFFFKIKDKPLDASWLSDESRENCPDQNLICMASLGSAGSVASGVCGGTAPLDGKGWALALRPTEQVVTPPATRFGVTTFSTHMPATGTTSSCNSNLGTVHVYNLNIATAAAVPGTTCNDTVTGGGLPPPTEKMDVCWNADCSIKKSVCIGCSTDSAIQGEPDEPPTATLGANGKRRVYWYIQK